MLSESWSVAESDVYDILRRVHIRTNDEDSLREWVEAALASLIATDPSTAFDCLASFALDNVHRELYPYDVWTHIESRGYRPRHWADDSQVLGAVAETSSAYVRSARAEAIGDQVIERPEAREILQCLRDADSPRLTIVMGSAGVGKSGTVAQVIEEVQQNSWPVLAFRVDRLGQCHSARDVGVRIGLPGDPAEVLDNIARHRACLLVIDQLDAISLVSGRNPQMFECVREIVDKASHYPHMRVLVSCRKFDLDNDARIRKWTRSKARSNIIVIQPFAEETVRCVLADLGFSPNTLSGRQIEILRLPLHLAMFVDVVRPSTQGTSTFESAMQLFDEYWERKQQLVRERRVELAWVQVLDKMCDYMSTHVTLSVPSHYLDDVHADKNALISENVIVQDRYELAFFHESFFDYAFARRFDARGGDLVKLLIQQGQQLFRRSQVRQILSFQRARSPSRYLQTLQLLLTHGSIRLHIKQVIIAWLASLTDPTREEWEVLRPLLLSPNEPFGWGIWRPWYQSAPWFRLLDTLGIITQWLDNDDTRLRSHAITMIASIQEDDWDRVADLLAPYVGHSDEWNHAVRHVVRRSTAGASERYFNLIGADGRRGIVR